MIAIGNLADFQALFCLRFVLKADFVCVTGHTLLWQRNLRHSFLSLLQFWDIVILIVITFDKFCSLKINIFWSNEDASMQFLLSKKISCYSLQKPDSSSFVAQHTWLYTVFLITYLTCWWRITYTVRSLFCAKMSSPRKPYFLKSPVFSVSHDLLCMSFYRGAIEKDNTILSKRWFDIWI